VRTTITIDINGDPHGLDQHTLTGAEIKALAHHEHGTLFRLEGDHRQGHPITDVEIVHLHDHERFEIEPEEHIAIRIEVDEETVVVHHRNLTGAEIKASAHRPPGNTLYRIQGNQRIKIADDEMVHLKEGECFVTMPPVGQAS
jgi:Multiubiquitin